MRHEEVRALQLMRVEALLERARATNEFYRPRLRDVGAIRSLEEFAARVPTVEKADFVADQEADPPYGRRHAHALALREPLLVATTSGTTGQGVEIHAQTASELAGTEACYAYLYRWAGLERGDALFLGLPITMMAGGQLELAGAEAYGLTVFPGGSYDARRKVELMRRFEPSCVLANTSYLGRLAALLDGEAWPGLKSLISGGESAGRSWLRRLESLWGVPVHDRYGSSQAGTDHMLSCRTGRMLHNDDSHVLVEVVDPDTGRHVLDGEEGELVITNLYRLDTPLIRCRIGDRAVYREPAYCGCGIPFMGVETATIARADDMKKVKNVNVWPQAVDDVVFGFDFVSEYEVVLTTSDEGADVATVRVAPRRVLAAGDAGALAAALRDRVGITFQVEATGPGELTFEDTKSRRWRDLRAHVVAAATAS